MNHVQFLSAEISIPLPVYVLVEDAGWWQGMDGSADREPYRNRLNRCHCLADYEALTTLSKKLSMRIGMGMVLGEWDRTDYLRNVTGATWMGANWNNRRNRGPWLDEAAEYLNANIQFLEIGLHGLCHEFWVDGIMQRSEFHDHNGVMRSPDVVREHLHAFASILAHNSIEGFPRLFVPPALNHSFGNGCESFQKILHEFGVQYVITRFARAKQYSPPRHEKITWEENVLLLERGESPVSWDYVGAIPPKQINGPVLPLHWANLLHRDPERNIEVVQLWVDALKNSVKNMNTVLACDIASCFRQAAAYYLADMHERDGVVEIDLHRLPTLVSLDGPIILKVMDHTRRVWNCRGGNLIQYSGNVEDIQMLEIQPDRHGETLQLYLHQS